VAFVVKTWTSVVVGIFRDVWSGYGEHCNVVRFEVRWQLDFGTQFEWKLARVSTGTLLCFAFLLPLLLCMRACLCGLCKR